AMRAAAVPKPHLPAGPRMAKAEQPKLEPATGSAQRTGEQLVVVVPSKATPNEAGRVPAQVFRLKSSLPEDRSYRMQKGDDLASVAKKFGVTPKSILVANAGKVR